MAEILSGGLTWGSIQQAIVTMDKEGHPLTCCNPVTGECLGGGGSSDFSTAEITIVNSKADKSNPLDNIEVNWPAVYNDVFNFPLAKPMSIPVPSTIKIPLYKGQLVYTVGSGADFLVELASITNVSGNIILNQQAGTITITGNGTIEVSGEK